MLLDQATPVNALLDGMAGDARVLGSEVATHMPTLYMFAHRWSFGHVVELGVGRGWSTVSLFAGALAAGKRLISYDISGECSLSLPKNLGLQAHHPLIKSWEFRVKDSVLAAADFPDGSVSCWFLDTLHTLEHTRNELAAWFPKVHPDGIMCGHDYLPSKFVGLRPGVKNAVDEFAKLHRDRFRLQVLPHDCGLFVLRPVASGERHS